MRRLTQDLVMKGKLEVQPQDRSKACLMEGSLLKLEDLTRMILPGLIQCHLDESSTKVVQLHVYLPADFD